MIVESNEKIPLSVDMHSSSASDDNGGGDTLNAVVSISLINGDCISFVLCCPSSDQSLLASVVRTHGGKLVSVFDYR